MHGSKDKHALRDLDDMNDMLWDANLMIEHQSYRLREGFKNHPPSPEINESIVQIQKAVKAVHKSARDMLVDISCYLDPDRVERPQEPEV